MHQIDKTLAKLNRRERIAAEKVLERISQGDLEGLDTQKLRDQKDVYRVRKGNLRFFFYRSGGDVRLLAVERRSTTTYRRRG